MTKYKNIDYLSLPQQVQKNSEAICHIIDIIDGTASMDIMWGTASYYTESGPFYGERIIDGNLAVTGDAVLVAGNGEDNGVYLVGPAAWTRTAIIETNQVVSIDLGDIYGGSQLKKLASGITKVVKKPERMKWRAY